MGSNSARRAVGILIVMTMVVVLQSVISFASDSVDHGGYRPHYQGYGVNTPGAAAARLSKSRISMIAAQGRFARRWKPAVRASSSSR